MKDFITNLFDIFLPGGVSMMAKALTTLDTAILQLNKAIEIVIIELELKEKQIQKLEDQVEDLSAFLEKAMKSRSKLEDISSDSLH